MKEIICFVGFKNSGKDTAAKFLIEEENFVKFSFAGSVKDCLSAIFSWDRNQLDGITPKDREWRETKDEYWSNVLKFDITPRKAMTMIGTDLFRKHFSDNIWIASLIKKIEDSTAEKIVITDGRFPNEIEAIQKLNGKIYQIQKEIPEYYDIALKYNSGKHLNIYEKEILNKVHASEYAFIGMTNIEIIKNIGSIEDLRKNILDIRNIKHFKIFDRVILQKKFVGDVVIPENDIAVIVGDLGNNNYQIEYMEFDGTFGFTNISSEYLKLDKR